MKATIVLVRSTSNSISAKDYTNGATPAFAGGKAEVSEDYAFRCSVCYALVAEGAVSMHFTRHRLDGYRECIDLSKEGVEIGVRREIQAAVIEPMCEFCGPQDECSAACLSEL